MLSGITGRTSMNPCNCSVSPLPRDFEKIMIENKRNLAPLPFVGDNTVISGA
jgi:hypothetical protein